ncbi:MAG: ADP-forming succinate--CoA ligase subunit beta [Acidobacteria bacterium]|nr:ADP-forming succinate--CoA ligase subunit beta [Acidobacteriota bacterium]MBU1338384.1 ADP-forming succinate--CoA ligase subunit beta [Acidobacteriota bacterium]MBU1473854.1 ADP-forming succinate--CoA ligase subunit beta [Acidobacteriota bacterium]MBU4255496.1 ADP-forming succinate--CoA ligase subunit beta [Acidobacteriota bacterium]MBU4330793.1 ADP-forming succinate--CoA ligase subunit beta [Acidobacteriota bacterium]
MKIHEYQAKQILSRFGVKIPAGVYAETPAQVRSAAEKIGPRVILKAQIHAGGRGKGGGIKLAQNPNDAEKLAGKMIGMKLITPQTGKEGKRVKKLYVEEALDIDRELYIGIVIDRATESPVVMASSEGGVEIEKVAAETPELIFKEYINTAAGFQAFQARKLAFKLGLKGDTFKLGVKFLMALYKAFEASDASLAEINPMLITKQGDVLALDAKMNFDDNALKRHPDIAEMRDLDEEDSLEVEAGKFDLNYIKLDGNVGCMVNGAGLAMATMDIIMLKGGMPANFLDVGGGVSEESVKNAFRILVSDPDVKAALVNIFGGIVRCDLVAKGIVKAAKEIGINIPVVIRLEGTNVELGKQILQDSGLEFYPASGMAEAAEKVVPLTKL